jgi:predicted RND superfamily exporter protein
MRSYAELVIAWRWVVLLLSLLATLFLGLQLRNLTVIVDADELLPRDHPFVEVTERVQSLFGNRYTVVVGITPKSGDVFTPEILAKVLSVTDAFAATPGVTPGNLQSLAAPRAKDIAGNADGLIVARLLDHVPTDLAEAQAIKARLAANPAYKDVLVSRDGRTTAIYVEFQKDPKGFGNVMSKVEAAIAPVRDASVSVAVAGQPVFLGKLETYSKRMGYLLPIAILFIGLIHLEAFRTVQGLILPLVTAVLALVWSLGIMTLAGVHLDPFNNVTPILILAVAAGHAVQMLKRYYEEFDRLSQPGAAVPPLSPAEASRQAVIAAMVRVGPVMIAACTIAALSFMSLIAFDIQAVRTFGIFCGLGIISIVAVELSFTPALRAILPPPRARETDAEKAESFWDKVAAFLARQVVTPQARKRVFTIAVLSYVALMAGASQVKVNNSLRSFFGAGIAEREDDRILNASMAGTNTFYVLVEGQSDDAIKDPAVLRAMEKTQAFLAAQPEVGHTLSLVDMLKQINRGMNGGAAAAGVLPASADLISQYLLLYSMSGEPGDFDGLVDYPYRNAIIQAFVKTDSSAFVDDINSRILPVIAENFPPGVTVRLGGSVTTPSAMNDVMVRGKIMNVLQILVVVFVVAAVLFRSPRLAALILVPLLATVVAVFGLMGAVGIPLQIATSTMAALAIGIGADYAIYFSWRLREELRHRQREGDAEAETHAVFAAYATAGKAVLFVATAVGGGYSVLMASLGFNIHLWLGLLTVASMIVAALSTLTLFAALLLTVRPKVIFPNDGEPARAPLGASPVPAAVVLLMAAGLAFGFLASPAQAQSSADAEALMAESLKATKAYRSLAVGRFVLTNKAGQSRIRQTSSVSELKPDGVHNRRLVRFSAPADIAGTAVLTIENQGADDDIWVYLPALKKVRRLPASGKKDAFVGTDFSYGDVIGHPVAEWSHKFIRSETLEGTPVRVIESLPRDPKVVANTGYGRRITWLRANDAVPVKTEYYSPQGTLL